MKDFKRFTVTAALPYANGPVHIGHLAGVYIPSDIYVRYLRKKGSDVAFICGSDEHGVPITIRAKKEGVSPQEVVDKYHEIIKTSFNQLGISFDIYSRTSAPVHHETAAGFFKKLYEKGAFEEKTSLQYFDPKAEQFLADRYIIGTCPNCGYEEAYGDQCERCGTSLSPSELINPRSALSGEKPVKKETKHWYLPMNEYENWLNKWILEEHKEWKSNVYGQCKSWLDGGLQPRAMTRDLDWGVPVPLEDAEGKVLYVWFDAPIGYISATKEWSEKSGKDWKLYWQDEDSRLVHFIGKDNIVFHCIIFPSILKAHGDYILPDNVPANEFLNLEGRKISTSKNWAVWLHEYLNELPGKEDVLRYTLCANAPETKDNDFTWKDFQAKNNSELVAILGNFINRAVVLTHKYFDGKVPARAKLFDIDEEVVTSLRKAPESIGKAIENYKFREALQQMMEVSRIGNKYLAETEPWKLIKENKERTGTILNIALQIVANLSVFIEPFLPFTSKKLLDMMDIPERQWEEAGNINLLAEGHEIKIAQLLFDKIEDSVVEEQVNKLNETRAANEQEEAGAAPLKPEIIYDDFAKLDIRIGEVKSAEKMPKSNKLIKLLIDLGEPQQRTILSGIANYFKPEELVGKQVCVVANLAPRKMMGIESQGMVLMAEDQDGTLRLLSPEESVKPGSGVS
ncbi:MAG: methionine--tRNA ligase [Candidatus Cyclobacteriaceae bacterium M2_1C_046]